jgi:hypothetical protein
MTVEVSPVSPNSIPVLTSSLASLSLHETPHEADRKIAELRERTLSTIRNDLPLTLIFDEDIEINLGEFIQSQMLFRRIVEFLATLSLPTIPVDKEFIAEKFEKSDLLAEIKALLPNDPTPYWESLYEACADVLNKKPFSKDEFNRALNVFSIFTLREALLVIQKNENNKQEWRRTLEAKKWVFPAHEGRPFEEHIKIAGECFIREYLRVHSLEKKSRPFKAELISTAEKLVPFVRYITKKYLWLYWKDFTDLSFRNPSGYNHHGLVAATIMDAYLNVLGYETQVKARFDLEPKVTLITAYALVQVTAPDSSRYLVDPCYLQIHQDICLDEKSLPTSSVLVLREDEVDSYIEEKLMVPWRATAELVKKKVASVLEKLSKQDQLSTFIIGSIDSEPLSNPEERVREGFKRVLDLSSYPTIRANFCYQGLFVKGICEKTKQLGIEHLTHYLPDEEVARRLTGLLDDPKLQGQNSPEALSLIAQLPPEQREGLYFSLLDQDPRIQDNIGLFFNAYFRSLQKIVTPERKDLSVVYGCSGADCISVMLATDAQEFTFVDLTPLKFQEFLSALNQMKANVYDRAALDQSYEFFRYQRQFGGAWSSDKGKLELDKLEAKFFYNLKRAGVDLRKVVLLQKGNEIWVKFPWLYYGEALPRQRRVIFVTADITNPDEYPPFLKEKLQMGFDIFYMKAAYYAPLYYPQFLPHIAKSIRPGGWLMTTDKAVNMQEVPPEQCLQQNGLEFEFHTSQEKTLLEDILIPESSKYPFYSDIRLDTYPKDKRHERTPTTDLTYWSILNLRKRMK